MKNTAEKATPEELREAFEILKRIVSQKTSDSDAMKALESGFSLVERIARR